MTGIQLRYELCACLLDARGPLTITELVARVEGRGFDLRGRAGKSVSDALRWEVRRGRVVKLGRWHDQLPRPRRRGPFTVG